jgi:hypothetical protein
MSIDAAVKTASSLEEGFENLQILVGFLVRGKMPALLEKYELRTRDGMRHAPCGERSDIHVVAAGDDQGRKVKYRELCGEIEVLGGLPNGLSDRRHEAEISHVRKVGIAHVGGIKHHAHVIHQTRLSGGLGIGGQALGFTLA